MALAPLSLHTTGCHGGSRPCARRRESGGDGLGGEWQTAGDADDREKQDQRDRDVDREHRENPAVTEARKEQLRGNDDRERDRDRVGRGLEAREDTGLVGRDELGEEERQEGDHRVYPELVDETNKQIAHRLRVACDRAHVLAEGMVLCQDDGFSAFLDSEYGCTEGEDHNRGDQGIRPEGDLSVGRRAGDDDEEDDLSEHLNAGGDTGEDAALFNRSDVREQGGVWIDCRVEEDGEQEDRDRETDERVDVEPGEQKEQGRKWDPDEHEWTTPAERGPNAVRDRTDRRLDDDALDASRARQEAGQEVGRAEALEDRRQDEVVEREEGAGSDGPGRVESGLCLGEWFHEAPLYST